MGNGKNISIQSFGWNEKSSGKKVFQKLSEKFKESELFQECSEDFKEYVKTSDALTYSGAKERLMDDLLTAQATASNEFHHVEPLLKDALHYATQYPYGISATVSNQNQDELNGYTESFGSLNIIHTTNEDLNKVLTSAKEIGYDNIILEIYKRKETGKSGINYNDGWEENRNG